MAPRTGRPTNDPKKHETRIRMSDKDIEKIDFCRDVLGLTKAEIIRKGIDLMYEKAQKTKK